jgi:hypothetical protein
MTRIEGPIESSPVMKVISSEIVEITGCDVIHLPQGENGKESAPMTRFTFNFTSQHGISPKSGKVPSAVAIVFSGDQSQYANSGQLQFLSLGVGTDILFTGLLQNSVGTSICTGVLVEAPKEK